MYQAIELPYSSLEPVLSSTTILKHYEIYQNYIKRFNQFLREQGIHQKESYISLLKNYEKYPISIRGDLIYYAGAILNHELYFLNMHPNGRREPVLRIKEAIDKKYGSYEKFIEAVKKEASYLVGSGYIFLGLDSNKELVLMVTSNQENSYLYDVVPLMVIDLWEHAYYLDYQNIKRDYINNFFSIINFNEAEKIYESNI